MDFGTVEYNQMCDTHNDHMEVPSMDHRGSVHSAHMRDSRMSYNHHSAGDRRTGYDMEPSRYGFVRQSPQKYRKGLLGLSNLGNTCFMNSALQCLTHTHGLQKYFRFCSHAYTSKQQSSRQKLLMAFAHWFERDWAKHVSAHYHSPEDILRSVQQLNPIFTGYAQQDSQEFLRCVLDNMHEELRREVPDDLDAYLQKRFGIEAHGDGASTSSFATASASSSSRAGGQGGNMQRSNSGGKGSMKKPTAAQSATRQLMQLCQSTEGSTDVGEIRLPEAATAAAQASSEFSSASSSCGTFAPAPPRDVATEQIDRNSNAGGSNDASTATSSSAPASKGEGEKENDAVSMHFSSIISELFQGRMVSIVRCLECNKTSRTEEVVYDVSVPIPSANEMANSQGSDYSPSGSAQHQVAAGMRGAANPPGPSLAGVLGALPGKVKSWFYDKGVEVTDCLRKHCSPELLTGKDKYYCEHCKRKNDCEKRIVFKDLPEILCIHLKRFRYDASWFNGTKNSKVVNFPVSKPLDMTPFLDTPPANAAAEFKMIGLIQHSGSMGAGHYIAYCQHKRKPQDWYEFDDVQVSPVSQEHVERAEAYVLFYQRLPSKGNKMDRANFKNEQRRVESQIRTYLMNHPVPRVSGAGDDPGGGGGSDSASAAHASSQATADEMRLNGPALRHLYRTPPQELDIVFVSKHWYVRLTTMSNPGPLNNFEYLCPHGLLGCYSVEMAAEPFIPISRSLFKSLVGKYGGGPVIESLEVCTKCQAHLRAYNDRKAAEYDLVSKYDTKDTGEGKHWYLVDALWVNRWKRYVRGEKATDIKDMCPPGKISNDRLFDRSNPTKIRDNLRLKNDYIGVNARVWWLFVHVHGGGPLLCREELNVYSADAEPERELLLDELQDQSQGSTDIARRISREFVDECHGDTALYEERYGECTAANDVVMTSPDTPVAEKATEDSTVDMVEADREEDRGGAAEDSAGGAEADRQLSALRAKLSESQARQQELREAGQQQTDGNTNSDSIAEELQSEVKRSAELQRDVERLEHELRDNGSEPRPVSPVR